MGIRLDWEIEAEQERVRQTGGEDPELRRKRRRARLRFFLVLFILLVLIGGGVGAVVLRLRDLDARTEQVLRDTVAAEVAALRLGDRGAFLNMQRSATNDWTQQQAASFDHYQTLKQTQNVNLSGTIVGIQVDGSRGRVVVEEIIDGVPYGQAWFYWHYEDGWRHVPPDYTFWGDARTNSADGVLVNYDSVDESFAQALAPQLSTWLKTGCAALGCATPSHLTVNVVPDPTLDIDWSASDPWTLQIPSPLINSSRLDMPFDPGTQVKVATLLAQRMIGDFNPTYPADAYYLRQGIISWLVQQFAQVETNSFLVGSLADHYGAPSVGKLLQAMQPASDISVINQITGTTLDAASLDWRDFLTWRLTVENELITRKDQTDFLTLYDPSISSEASTRYAAGAGSDPLVVISAIPEQASDGAPQLHAVVQIGSPAKGQEDVLFRLINGIWKRAS